MKLAINYSPASAELYRQGVIFIDRFKVPDWPDLVDEASMFCPSVVHFSLQAGSGRLEESDWTLIERLQSLTETLYINLHLDAHKDDFPGIPLDTKDLAHMELVYERLLKDTMAVVNRYGAERVIVENVPYKGNQGEYLRPCADPGLITRLVEQVDCGLLLDISHACLAARYLGIPEKEYLTQLPTHSIREMHTAGIHNLPGGLQDHLPMLEGDWQILAWVLERIKQKEWSQPWLLAFEYGGVGAWFGKHTDPVIIANQVPRLYDMVHSI